MDYVGGSAFFELMEDVTARGWIVRFTVYPVLHAHRPPGQPCIATLLGSGMNMHIGRGPTLAEALLEADTLAREWEAEHGAVVS